MGKSGFFTQTGELTGKLILGKRRTHFPLIVLAKSLLLLLSSSKGMGKNTEGEKKKPTLRLLGFFFPLPEKRKQRNDVIFAYSKDALRCPVFKLRRRKKGKKRKGGENFQQDQINGTKIVKKKKITPNSTVNYEPLGGKEKH